MTCIQPTKKTALCVSGDTRPLFDIGIQRDRHHYNSVYYLTIFGVHITFEVVHYNPERKKQMRK